MRRPSRPVRGPRGSRRRSRHVRALPTGRLDLRPVSRFRFVAEAPATELPRESPVESELREVGLALAAAFPSRARHPLRALDAKAMERSSEDAELRAALFRLVDVTPATRSLDDLARHLTEYLDDVDERPPSLDVAMKMGGSAPGRRALGAAAAAGVRPMAHRFIVGSSPADAVSVLRGLWNDGVASSVDLLGEATVTQAEADRYAARCSEALDVLAGAYRGWPEQPQLERDSAGPLPRANLSVKGAYWDHEVIEARQHGWAAPVFEDKAACDRNYEELTRRLLDARPRLRVAIASHNLRSVAHAIAYDQSIGGKPGDVEFQVLRGLGDDR